MKTKIKSIYFLLIAFSIVACYPLKAQKFLQMKYNTQRYNVWKNGKYLNNRQRAIMGYLNAWNQSDPIDGSSADCEPYVAICSHRGVFGLESKGLIRRFNKSFPADIMFPENTLGSFLSTFALNNGKGVEMVEMDIRLTKDNVPILMHDQTMGRATNPSFDPYNKTKFAPGTAENMMVNKFRYKGSRFSQLDGINVWLNNNTYFSKQRINDASAETSGLSLEGFLRNLAYMYNASLTNQGGIFPAQNFPILVLDIKNADALKYCMKVVNELKIFRDRNNHNKYNTAINWVIFKLDVSDMWKNNKVGTGGTLINFDKKIGSDFWQKGYNNYGCDFNIIPYFLTRTPNLIDAYSAAKALMNKPYLFTLEFNPKEGGTFWSEERYSEMGKLVQNFRHLKLGCTHATPSAYWNKNNIDDLYSKGQFFDGFGNCCIQFKDLLVSKYKRARSYTTLKPRFDEYDYRWKFSFLVGGLMNKNERHSFRYITTEYPEDWIRNLGKYYIGTTLNSANVAQANSTTSNEETSLVDTSSYKYEIPILTCARRDVPYTAKKIVFNNVTSPYFIGSDNRVYQLDSNGLKISLGGQALDVAVEEDGTPWHIGTNNRIYTLDSASNWYPLPGLAKKIAIGGKGEAGADYVTEMQKIAIIGTDDFVYVLDTESLQWKKNNNIKAKEIAVDATGDIWLIDLQNKIWQLAGDSLVNIGGVAKKISCSLDGHIAVIGTDNNIWAYNRTTDQWQKVFNSNKQYIELALADAMNAYAITSNGEIWSILDDCTEDTTPLASLVTTEASVNVFSDALDASKISIYPNPAHEKVTLKLAAGMEKASVSIINSLGITVVIDNTIGLQRVISIAGKPSGMYLVRVTTTDGISTTQKLSIL